jgi:hypothetical protein
MSIAHAKQLVHRRRRKGTAMLAHGMLGATRVEALAANLQQWSAAMHPGQVEKPRGLSWHPTEASISLISSWTASRQGAPVSREGASAGGRRRKVCTSCTLRCSCHGSPTAALLLAKRSTSALNRGWDNMGTTAVPCRGRRECLVTGVYVCVWRRLGHSSRRHISPRPR